MAVVVIRVLKRLGLAPDAVVTREFGAIGASDTTLLPQGTPVSACEAFLNVPRLRRVQVCLGVWVPMEVKASGRLDVYTQGMQGSDC